MRKPVSWNVAASKSQPIRLPETYIFLSNFGGGGVLAGHPPETVKRDKTTADFFFSLSSRERSEKPARAALKLLMKESERGICFNMLSQNGIFKGVWIKTSDTKKSVPNKRTYLSQSCWLASIADMWVLKQNSLQKFKKKKREGRKRKITCK